MIKTSVKVDLRNLKTELNGKFKNRVYTKMEGVAESVAIGTGNWMRRQAPWTDRTGEARRTSVAFVKKQGLVYSVIIGIGVWYGRFLELANGGRFRIVEPARFYGENILKEILTKTTYGS